MPDAEEDEGEAEDAVGAARVRDWGIWGGEARWGAEEVEDEWGLGSAHGRLEKRIK